MSDWLPKIVVMRDTPDDAVARLYRSVRKLPEPVVAAMWSTSPAVGVGIRPDFPWPDAEDRNGAPWKEVGGYWKADTSFAVINAAWPKSDAEMDAVVFHEVGHALSLTVLSRPHLRPDFRAAWRAARRVVRERWPAEYRARRNMGVYCIHWTCAVQEVWAEAFAWLHDARATTHHAFGNVFAECIELVRAEVAAL